MKLNWKVKKVDEQAVAQFSRVFNLNERLATLLFTKGISTLHDAYNFLNPNLSTLYSPFLMKGMTDAVKRIRNAVRKEEKVGIFSDSDLDGLTSLAILLNLFNRIGIESCYRYPVNDEDYGLRSEVIDELYEKGVKLLITLDTGMRDIKEIEYAKELGMDVIVCDHHEPGNEAPDAVIVNPKQEDCNFPFRELAGVGVAFKLCHGVLMSYLKSYDRLFILMIKDAEGINLSYIRNGIIEKTNSLSSFDSLKDLSNELEDNDEIIFFNFDGDEDSIRSLFKDRNIYDLKSLGDTCSHIEQLLNDEANTCLFEEVFRSNSDIGNVLFSEIEFNKSPKIKGFIESIIGLVSIGTIADIVPIRGENRTIVYYGIKSINSTDHPGLSLLLNNLNKDITSKSIAWDISPLLNSPGRFGKSDLTARFLLEDDTLKLKSILDEIMGINDKRKKIISEIYNYILNEIEDGKLDIGENLLFIQSASIPEGLAGLLANQLTGSINKPVIVVSLFGQKEIVKGSGRTADNIDFFSFVEPYSHMFEKIGGHSRAFGFTASKDNIKAIRDQIEIALSDHVTGNNECQVDLEIPINTIDLDFMDNLSILEPFGFQNEPPVFLTKDVMVKSFFRFGGKKNHGKYKFFDSNSIEAIGWNMADTMERHFEKKPIDIIYKLENNEYNGLISPRMIIVDID